MSGLRLHCGNTKATPGDHQPEFLARTSGRYRLHDLALAEKRLAQNRKHLWPPLSHPGSHQRILRTGEIGRIFPDSQNSRSHQLLKMNPIPKPALEKLSAPAFCELSGCKMPSAYTALSENRDFRSQLPVADGLLSWQRFLLVPDFNKQAEIGGKSLNSALSKDKNIKDFRF
jgi:hypothetical protein